MIQREVGILDQGFCITAMIGRRRDADADTLRGYDRSAEATFSPHLWRGTLPTDLAAGAHRIEVRAFDAWRGEVRAQGEYRLHDAEP